MSDYRPVAIRTSLTFIKALLVLTGLLLVLVIVALTTQVFTQSIASRLVIELNSRTGLEISYDNIEGTPIHDLHIKGLALQIGPQKIRAEDLQVEWNPIQLMSGLVDIDSLQISGVSLVIAPSAENSETGNELLLQTIEPLGIELILRELLINGFSIQTNDQTVTLDAFQTALEIDKQKITLAGIFARLDDNELTGDITILIGDEPAIDSHLAWYSPFIASVIPEGVLQAFPQLGSEVPSGEIFISGWTSEMSLRHTLNSPFTASSQGTVRNPLSLNELRFTFDHGIDTLELDTGTGSLTTLSNLTLATEGNLDTQLFRLSMGAEDARLTDLEISAEATLSRSNLQIQTFELRTQTGIASGNVIINFADSLVIDGHYSIEDTAPLSLFNFSTPFELANLTSNGDFSASFDSQTYNGLFSVSEFLGELSGYPLNGTASVRLLNSIPIIEQLRLSTSDNSLSIVGNPLDEAGVSWSLQAPALHQLLTDAEGSMNGSGTLSNASGNVKVAGNLVARDLGFQSYYADGIDIAFDFTDESVSAKVQLQRIGTSDNESIERITAANLELSGNPSQHRLSGFIRSPYMNLTPALQGSLRQTGDNWNWSGSLSTAELESSYGLWRLESALRLTVNDSLAISVEGGCFAQSDTQLCASVAGVLQESLEAEFSLEDLPLSLFNQSPDTNFDTPFITPPIPLLPPGFSLAGAVSGSLSTQFSGSSPTLNLNLESEGTQLTINPSQFADAEESPEFEPETQTYQIDRFSIFAAGSLERLELGSQIEINEVNLDDEPFATPGQVSAQLVVSDLQSLEGEVRINLPSLDWAEAVVSGASNVQGSLVSNISIDGTIEQPALGGNIGFSDLALDVDALGIRLVGLNFNAQQTQDNSYVILGSVNSDEGSATVRGQVRDLFLPNWSVDAQLSGNNFQLINRPELSIAASPDLRLRATGQLIDIQGDLGVSKLQLDVEGLPDTAIDVSRDVVITNYSSTSPNQNVNVYVDERSLFSIPISADVSVALKDDIRFTGFGISAQLDGDINYRQSESGASSTYGELSIIAGSYQAYQQQLVIKQGQLLFFGALDNPALDIRAIREVNDITVGVLMNGTLKSINSQLFSTPALPENDIISLIATGRKFSSIGEGDGVNVLNTIANLGLNRSQGLTNSMRDKLGLDALQITNTGDINNSILTVGKYVTPDIFIRYGVGLFDSQSKISVDYTLSEHLKLQAESGEFQSIDITYTVEK